VEVGAIQRSYERGDYRDGIAVSVLNGPQHAQLGRSSVPSISSFSLSSQLRLRGIFDQVSPQETAERKGIISAPALNV